MKKIKLTNEQIKIYEKLFSININNGLSEKKAESETIEGLKEQFKELNKTMTGRYKIIN